MRKTAVSLAAVLALLVPSALLAERINPETDLLNGVLPSPSSFTRVAGSVCGTGGNQDYLGQYLTMDDDSKTVSFNLTEVDTEGCGCDFTLSPVGAFNTYAIRCASDTVSNSSRAPKKWQVWGKTSATDAEWILLSTEENQTNWDFTSVGEHAAGTNPKNGETRFYRFPYNAMQCKYIRFRFLENNGDTSKILVTRIIPYPATTASTGATAETFASCEDLVPVPTSENASRYTSTTHAASGGDYYATGNLQTPFSDGDPARVMMKNVANGTANLIYEFGVDDKKIVNGYMVRFPNHTNTQKTRAPYAWTFSGSDDKNAWTTLDSRDEQIGWEKNEKRYYAFENHTKYAFYKIEFTANNGETRDDYYYEFGNLDYYFRQPDKFFFTALDASYSDGEFTISGAITDDSLATHVSLTMVTNGIPFVLDCGTVQPGGTFSTNLPFSSGVIGGMLTGIAGSHTNSVVEGPAYIPGADSTRTRFVSTSGNDENAGTSLEAPMLHIADAVASLGNVGGTVFVLPGTYTETNDLTAVELSSPVAVIGVTGNPADATVTQAATYGYARVFKLTHASALLRALTITGGKVQNEPKGDGVTAATANTSPFPSVNIVNGGNILMTAGLVENCVISGGNAARFSSLGGNIRIEGGRVSRCVLVGGTATRNYFDGNNEGYGSISATGGVVENCVIRNCRGGYAPIGADGTSKFVNCTVVGNTGSDACGGFVILGNDSRVINTVIFGNENKGAQETAHGNPANGTCNQYIATKISKKIPSNVTAAFVNCATDGDTPINSTCRLIDATAFADYANGDYAPASKESPLVNKVADYAASGGVADLDLANKPRVCGPKADIGAFEFQYVEELETVIIFR